MFSRFLKKFAHFLLLCGFIALPLLVPHFKTTFDLSTVTSVISLLFAILIGFFIASATTNYFRLQTLLAQENAACISLYDIGSLLKPKEKKKLADAIDLYAIAALNFELEAYVEKTLPIFQNLTTVVNQTLPSSPQLESLLENLHDIKSQLIATRQEIPLVARRIVTRMHWSVLISLAILLSALMYLLRDGTILGGLIVGILTAACYLTLILLHQIDGNLFAEEKMAFQNAQIIFESIGKLPYFPWYALEQGRVKALPKPYRTGTFQNPAYPLKTEIKVMR